MASRKMEEWNKNTLTTVDDIEQNTKKDQHYICYELLDPDFMEPILAEGETLYQKYEEIKDYP